jgi:hypothetical protein
MSDWGATHSTSIMAGLDQEMPTNLYMGPALEKAVQAGTIPVSAVDDSVMRMLTPMFQMGLFDTPSTGDVSRNVTSVAHNQLARTLAAASTVLLKNEGGLLPLSPKSIGSGSSSGGGGRSSGGGGDSESIVRSLGSVGKIAVLGVAASDAPIVHGNGSGHVDPPYIITGLQGVTARAGPGVDVVYDNGMASLLSLIKALTTLTTTLLLLSHHPFTNLSQAYLSHPPLRQPRPQTSPLYSVQQSLARATTGPTSRFHSTTVTCSSPLSQPRSLTPSWWSIPPALS